MKICQFVFCSNFFTTSKFGKKRLYCCNKCGTKARYYEKRGNKQYEKLKSDIKLLRWLKMYENSTYNAMRTIVGLQTNEIKEANKFTDLITFN